MAKRTDSHSEGWDHRLDGLVDHLRPRRSTLIWGSVMLSIQAYLVLTYVSITGRSGGVDLFVVVPWIWINVALWAIARTTPKPVSGREQLVSLAIACGYFLVLAAVSGLIGLGATFSETIPSTPPRLILFEAPPGWAPSLMYGGEYIRLALRPPLLIGYAAIAYLLYATITEVRSALLGGVVGLFSCVGCMVPIVVSVVGALTGGTAGLLNPGNISIVNNYGISTVVFLVTIALLYGGHVVARE